MDWSASQHLVASPLKYRANSWSCDWRAKTPRWSNQKMEGTRSLHCHSSFWIRQFTILSGFFIFFFFLVEEWSKPFCFLPWFHFLQRPWYASKGFSEGTGHKHCTSYKLTGLTWPLGGGSSFKWMERGSMWVGKTHHELLQACFPSVSPSSSSSALEQSRIQKTHISLNLTLLPVVLEVGGGGGCREL